MFDRMLHKAYQAIYGNKYHLFMDIAVSFYAYYLKHKRFNDDFWKLYAKLRELESISIPEQEVRQSLLLVNIVRHAYENVPFYRQRFDQYGIHPKQIHGIKDLKCIPFLLRSDIQNFSREMTATNLSRRSYSIHSTSGSTGAHLSFPISKFLHWTVKYASIYQHYAWAGISPGDRRVTLGGRQFVKNPPYWIYNRWENQLLLSIHHLNSDTGDSYIKKIAEFQPVFLQGHPSGLARLAERMLGTGQIIQVKAVFTTGETITIEQRSAIQEAFQCSVYDAYGQGEGLFFAGECEMHSGLHEFSHMGLIELIPFNNPDKLSAVIGTSLHNYAMPMLRYQIGDLAVEPGLTQCSCGRGLPLKVKSIIGRIDDRIYLSQNPRDYILPVTIRMYIKPLLLEGQNYKLHQRDIYDLFDFWLASPETVTEKQKMEILQTLHALLGEQVSINFRQCDKIMTSGGKVRNVVSDIARELSPIINLPGVNGHT